LRWHTAVLCRELSRRLRSQALEHLEHRTEHALGIGQAREVIAALNPDELGTGDLVYDELGVLKLDSLGTLRFQTHSDSIRSEECNESYVDIDPICQRIGVVVSIR
jgi:hypothetical protein